MTGLSRHADYYEVLDVERDAPPAVLRAAYRRLMQQRGHHPDLGGDNATAALINKAYAVLSDPRRRGEYDLRLDAAAEGGRSPGPVRILDPARECVFCATPHPRGLVIDLDSTCDVCRSPLCSPREIPLDADGQRGTARIEKRLDVRFFTDRQQTRGFAGRTVDLSMTGMRMLTARPVPPGQRIRVASGLFEAVGVVAHRGTRRKQWRSEYAVGVSFVTLRWAKKVGGLVSQRV